MRRTFFLSVIAFLFLNIILTGCSGSNQGSSSNGSSKTKPSGITANQTTSNQETNSKKVTLTFWRAGSDSLETSYWQEAIKIYEKSHPNITIQLTSIPWGNEIETKLNTAYVGGTFPDLISYSIASVATHAALGQYLPLDDYAKNWSGKNDIFPKVLNEGEYNGKLYGIGFIPDPRILTWRKDYFKEAGLDPNKPPATWDELEQDALKLAQKKGNTTIRSGFTIPTLVDNGDAAQLWQSFAIQDGSPIIDAAHNKALFDNPKGVEAASFLTKLYREGVSIPEQAGVDQFAQGQSAMGYNNPSSITALLKNNPNLKGQIGYAPPIKKVSQATFSGLRLMFIGSKTKHPQEAWDFIQFLLTQQETWRRYQVMNAPVVLQSLKDKFIKDNPELNNAVYQAVESGVGYPIVPYSFTFMEIISQALQESYYGKKTPDQAFKDANASFEKQLPNLLKSNK